MPDTVDGGKGGAASLYKAVGNEARLYQIMYDDGSHGVYVAGDKEGRVRLEYRQQMGKNKNLDNDPVLAYYEFDVVTEKVLPIRVNLLSGGDGAGTTVTADKAAKMIQVANVYLRQIGVSLEVKRNTKVTGKADATAVEGKPGYFTVKTDKKYTANVTSANAVESVGLNYLPAVAQITFIQSFVRVPGRRGPDTTQGLNSLRPDNANGEKVTATYRLTANEKTAKKHTMKLLKGSQLAGKPKLWGVVIADTGDGKTLAHELGHLLNLDHRGGVALGRGADEGDGLNLPISQNLMYPGGAARILPGGGAAGPQDQDLDLAQLIAARGSKALQ